MLSCELAGWKKGKEEGRDGRRGKESIREEQDTNCVSHKDVMSDNRVALRQQKIPPQENFVHQPARKMLIESTTSR